MCCLKLEGEHREFYSLANDFRVRLMDTNTREGNQKRCLMKDRAQHFDSVPAFHAATRAA